MPQVGALQERCSDASEGADGELRLFDRGLDQLVTATVQDGGVTSALVNLVGTSAGNSFVAAGFDRTAQEDARRLTWRGPATLRLGFAGIADSSGRALEMLVKLDARPQGKVTLGKGRDTGRDVDLTQTLGLVAQKGFRTISVPLACLDAGGSGCGPDRYARAVFECTARAGGCQCEDRGAISCCGMYRTVLGAPNIR